jgi:hypothetical protein
VPQIENEINKGPENMQTQTIRLSTEKQAFKAFFSFTRRVIDFLHVAKHIH